MGIVRLMVLPLLISVCVAQPVAARSLPDKTPPSSQPQLHGLVAPPEFRAHALLPPPNVWARGDANVGFQAWIDTLGQIRDTQPPLRVLLFDPTLAQNDTLCYSMRSYRVTRDDPASDSTRLAGYSECQPAARFQVKAAVDSLKIEFR